jgi:DMSO/TMAO reductase YedYZ molybdopterin-dependent catalytic subunit
VRERLGAPLKHNEYPTQKAYLVFEDIAARERAFELFSSAEAGTLLYDLYPCCRPAAPEELLLHAKHRLKVSKRVDEPSNIRWENLSLTTEERIFRGVCVALLLLLTMLLTFALLLVANIVRPADATSCP